MKIIHIASLTNRKDSGVSVIVPQYFLNEMKINSETYLLSVGHEKIRSLSQHKNYYEQTKISTILYLLNKIKPDIVVIHEVYYPIYLKISNYLLIHKIPYIIVPHGCLTKAAQNNKKIKKAIGNIIFSRFLKGANSYHFLSLNEKKDSIAGKHNYYICGNGINAPKENKHIFNESDKSIVYIGRVNYYHKGIDLLIEACNLCQKELRSKSVTVKIYGTYENDVKVSIQKYIKEKNISDILTINGPTYGEEKNEILKTCLAFIQVSRFEGQPIGIMEAMALGAPIIAARGTTFEEIVSNHRCGIGCKNNKTSIKDAIIRLINSDNLEDYSEQSFNFIRKEYNWDKISQYNIKEYENRATNN